MTKRFLLPVVILALSFVGCSNQKSEAPAASASDQPAAAASAPASSTAAQSYTGEVMDSACASMGSHDGMMQQAGAKNAKECTLKCVAAGSKFVLYDAASKTTYELSDQTKAKDFAGQKVKVTGTFDSSTKTITVQSIEAA